MSPSAFDATAPEFDRHRMLPDGVPEAIRSAVLGLTGTLSNPSLLDLGAGAGRIGRPFVAAGDNYIGVDLSFGMLRAFIGRGDLVGRNPGLAQCDGESLPFRDGSFDVVMLIQVVGGARGWRRLIAEARRVLQGNGALVIGKTISPPDGVDARLKERLDEILEDLGVQAEEKKTNAALSWLESEAREKHVHIAASWMSERSPRGFLDRKPTGARFSQLGAAAREESLRRLATWATATFESLESVRSEPYAFELTTFRFAPP
jgi:ubiquinone/menaquinone biosynthesis C-methylase UbiE